MGSRRADREWKRPRVTRHLWIRSESRLLPPTQGFVLEWRRQSYMWSALVQYVKEEPEHPPLLLAKWFPAERLWPVRSDPDGPTVLDCMR